jgi:hypothetical protein
LIDVVRRRTGRSPDVRTLVAGGPAPIERLVCQLLGVRGVSAVAVANRAREVDLQRFPHQAWCQSQESNQCILERLRDRRWHQLVGRVAAREDVDPDRLDRLMQQAFAAVWGRKLDALRVVLAIEAQRPIRLASDLPRPVLEAFLADQRDRVSPAPVLSALLRTARVVQGLVEGLGRHALRVRRLLRTRRLPPRPARVPRHVAWLNALPSEVSDGDDRLSVVEFLREAQRAIPDDVEQIVVQGARPARLDAVVVHRPFVPPMRYRPPAHLLRAAVIDQLRQAVRSLGAVFDFRRQTLADWLLTDLPGIRMWFGCDAPLAVLYPNHVIGREPAVALVRHRFDVASLMVFYSANIAYAYPPRQVATVPTMLPPEARAIVADRITMWSPEMTGVFQEAGYAPDRLACTGPVVFGRRGSFTPTSRYLGGPAEGPLRIGVFDVSVVSPRVRCRQGFGLLLYNSAYAFDFFRDIIDGARACCGGEFVLVRKLKRELSSIHEPDVDFARLPAARVQVRVPSENLWRTLEQVDLVLCMPFTSVAYLAHYHGIPAAHYDPSASVHPTPLGGGAPLLYGGAALARWLAAPERPPHRVPDGCRANVLRAAMGSRS